MVINVLVCRVIGNAPGAGVDVLADVDASMWVATITALAQMYGAAVKDAKGANLFGGHSLRTGGAAFLASRGINPYKIQALGRWRSPLVIHYAGAAMASGLARDLSISDPGPPVAETEASGVTGSLEICLPSNADPPEVQSSKGLFATNPFSRAVHWPPSHSSGKTRCGWAFSGAFHNEFNKEPHAERWHLVCDRCLPELRNKLMQSDIATVQFTDDEEC